MQQIFIEQILWAGHCSRQLAKENKQTKTQQSLVLGELTF